MNRLFNTRAGFIGAATALLGAPAARPAVKIAPNGTGDGSSWADAAPLSKINDMIALAAEQGAEVWLRADTGPYAQNGNLPITKGGTATQRVMIRGVDVNGLPMAARIVGSRANPWRKGLADGADVFRLRSGADHLGFAFIRFEDQGYGCIRSHQPHTDLLIEDCSFANVRAFYENGSSGHGVDATVSNITIRRCKGLGWSKHFARFRYASHDILVEDCTGNALEQDGDNFCNGVILEGSESVGLAPDGLPNGVHDVVVRRCSMGNCRDSLNVYQNGDAFGSEGQDYNVLFEDCHGWGCSDAAFDCKSRNTRFVRCSSDTSKRGFRVWGDAVAIDCVVTNPLKRGGTGAAACISTFKKGYLRWYGGRLEQTGTNSLIVAEDGGFTAYTPRTVIIKPVDAPLSRIEANSVVTTIDEADHTPPVMTSTTTGNVNENKIASFTATADKPFTLRRGQTLDAAQFVAEGQKWQLNRQDYENDRSVGQDQTYRMNLRMFDANGNHSDNAVAVSVNNVDDNPISAEQLLADGVTGGGWWQINDLSTLCTDRAGTIPVTSWSDDGDPQVRFVRDKFGFGNNLVAPDDASYFYLRHDEAGAYWLEPASATSYFYVGGAGALRLPRITSVMGIYREPGETQAGVIISVPRSLTIPTASNAVWWQLVQGGQSYGARLPNGGNSATSTGNHAIVGLPLILTLQSEPGIARSNAVDTGLALTANPSMSYPVSGRARLFADGNAAQLFTGRFYGGVVTNRTELETVRFRIERQIAEWANLTL